MIDPILITLLVAFIVLFVIPLCIVGTLAILGTYVISWLDAV